MTQPPAHDVAAVLAELLAAIDTYNPLMFTDQHRALFERYRAHGGAGT